MPAQNQRATGYITVFDKEQRDGLIRGDDEKLYIFQLDDADRLDDAEGQIGAGSRVTFSIAAGGFACGKLVPE
jgi:hypothetical protein